MNDLPKFVRDQTEDEVQPVAVRRQGPYIAIIQWDGTGEQQHWVLVPIPNLTSFIDSLEDAAL